MRRSATAHERYSEQTRCQSVAETRTDECRVSLQPRADHAAITSQRVSPPRRSSQPRLRSTSRAPCAELERLRPEFRGTSVDEEMAAALGD